MKTRFSAVCAFVVGFSAVQAGGVVQVTEEEHARRSPFYQLFKTPEAAFENGREWHKLAESATTGEKRDDYLLKARLAFELAGWLSGEKVELRFSAALSLAECWLELSPGTRAGQYEWSEIATNGNRPDHPAWPMLLLRRAENFEHVARTEVKGTLGEVDYDFAAMTYVGAASKTYDRILESQGLAKLEHRDALTALAQYRGAICHCVSEPAGVRTIRRRNKKLRDMGDGTERCVELLEAVTRNPRIPATARAHASAEMAFHLSVAVGLDGTMSRKQSRAAEPAASFDDGASRERVSALAASAEKLLAEGRNAEAWQMPWKSYLPPSVFPTEGQVRGILATVQKVSRASAK